MEFERAFRIMGHPCPQSAPESGADPDISPEINGTPGITDRDPTRPPPLRLPLDPQSVWEQAASNGPVAVSALGSGRACPATFIASVRWPLYGAFSVRSRRGGGDCGLGGSNPLAKNCREIAGNCGKLR